MEQDMFRGIYLSAMASLGFVWATLGTPAAARADDPDLNDVPEATLVADINTLTAELNALYPWEWALIERTSRMIEYREIEIDRRRLLAARVRPVLFPAYSSYSGTWRPGVTYRMSTPVKKARDGLPSHHHDPSPVVHGHGAHRVTRH
jgi:hypothetical protein